MSTPWSTIGDQFLSEGEWAIGQGPDAPDRLLLRHLLSECGYSSLIDVGCGPGIEVDGLRETGLLERVDYLGLDFTPELIESCRDRHPGVNFQEANVERELPTRADIVWCRHVLEHVENGEAALRNVISAATEVAIVSWFIRPTWAPHEVGAGVSEGFIHQTYSARRMIEVARDGDRRTARFDFDHHLTRCSVWLIAPDSARLILPLAAATDFVDSDAFLDALIPAPEEPWRSEAREALRTAWESSAYALRLLGG